MSVNVLAIDQGSSATKAVVVSPAGTVLGASRVPVATQASGDGAVEQDPREILASVLAAGAGALRAARAPVAAVGLANQGETVLRWDRSSGEPLGRAISWQDRRAAGVTRALAHAGPRLEEVTGLPLDPYFAAPKMAWLRAAGGEEGTISTIDAWLNRQLTGAFVTDAATASRTMLLDLEEIRWSTEACDVFGLDPEDQPRIADCDATLGVTRAFGGELPITGAAVDQQAALFGQSCFVPGLAKCTYGTGAFVLATAGGAALRSRARLAACVAWRLRGRATYCLDGQVYTAGSVVSWLERLGLLGAGHALDRHARDPVRRSATVFVPSLAGLAAPFWAPEARGGWIGLSMATTREDLVGAAMDGIAAHVALVVRAMETDFQRPLERLRVDGGLSRSSRLMQTQADLLQLPVERYPSEEATALGVAALARLGISAASTPDEAVGPWRPAECFEPTISADEAEARLERFRAAAEALAGLAETPGARG